MRDTNIIKEVRERRLITFSRQFNIHDFAYTGGDELRKYMRERYSYNAGPMSEYRMEVTDLCLWFPATWLGPLELEHIQSVIIKWDAEG